MEPRFHAAQAAIATADLLTLRALIEADPTLANTPSTDARDHPTLLQCLVLTMPAAPELPETIKRFAELGANLDDPLVAAAGMDNTVAIESLLDLGANLEGGPTWSPLEEALYWGQAATVDLLLSRGATVRNLRVAAALGDLARVQACFDPAGKLIPDLAGEVAWPFGPIADEALRTDPAQVISNALVHASAWGRGEVVAFLLDQGAEIDQIPAGFDFAGTALHYAALRNQETVVDLLLSRGADPSIRDTKINAIAADWAAHEGHTLLAERLAKLVTTS